MKKNGARRDVVNHGTKPDPAICEHPDGIDLSHHNVGYDWSKGCEICLCAGDLWKFN